MNASSGTGTLDVLTDAIGQGVIELATLCERLRALHARLAEAPAGDEAAEAELRRLLRERRRLEQRLGHALGRALIGRLPMEAHTPDRSPTCDDAAGPSPEPRAAAADPTPAAPMPPTPAAPMPPAPPEPQVAPPREMPREEAPPELEPPAAVGSEAPAPAAAPEPPPARGPRATPSSLEELERRGVGSQAPDAGPSGRQRADRWLVKLREAAGRPLAAADAQVLAPLDDLIARLDDLALATQAEQRAAIGLLACRLRSLQERAQGPEAAFIRARIEEMFPKLSAFSRVHRPGWVLGLGRGQQPEQGTWDDEASPHAEALGVDDGPAQDAGMTPEHALDALRQQLDPPPDPGTLRELVGATLPYVRPDDPRLVALVADRYDDLKGDRRLQRLRKAIRAAARDDAPAEDAFDPAWPWAHLTQGKVGVLVGGSERPDARERLRRAFGFSRLEWFEPRTRTMASLAERIRRGSVQVCILLRRFVPHEADDVLLSACKEAGVPWVSVEHGYGELQVRTDMERQWGALRQP